PYSARSGGTRQQHDLWTGRERLEREYQRCSSGGVADQGGSGMGEQHQSFRRSLRLWWISRERLRTRRGKGRTARVSRTQMVQKRARTEETREPGRSRKTV